MGVFDFIERLRKAVLKEAAKGTKNLGWISFFAAGMNQFMYFAEFSRPRLI